MQLRGFVLVALLLAVQTPFLAQLGWHTTEVCRLGETQYVTLDSQGELASVDAGQCECTPWAIPVSSGQVARALSGFQLTPLNRDVDDPIPHYSGIRDPPFVS